MDRYFYSVEMDGDRKVIHMSGNIYYIVCDVEPCYRLAEWTFLYIGLDELAELVNNDTLYAYVNQRVNYLTDITTEEAIWTCNSYHNGRPGEELNIKHVNEDTPCGDYWFE